MMTVGEKGRYETIGLAVAVKDMGIGRFGVKHLLAIGENSYVRQGLLLSG